MASSEGTWTRVGGIAGVLGVLVAIVFGIVQFSTTTDSQAQRSPTPTSDDYLPSPQNSSEPNQQPPSTEDADTASEAVRRAGRITVSTRNRIDLDSPPSDPQWTGSSSEISYSTGWIMIPRATSVASTPTFDQCRTATGHTTVSMADDDIEPGTSYCVITSSDRYATIYIDSVDLTAHPNLIGGGEMTVDVIVWENPAS